MQRPRNRKRERVLLTLLVLACAGTSLGCGEGSLAPDPEGVEPVLYEVVPSAGPVLSDVTLFGEHLAGDADKNTVRFANVAAEVLEVHVDPNGRDSILTRVPVGTPEAQVPVTVEVGGKASNEIYFTVVPRNFDVGQGPLDVITGDFNRDGVPDLVTANIVGHDVSVLLGMGGADFTAARNHLTAPSPRSLALGDFDSDGNPDLVIAYERQDFVSILAGNGKGAFRVKYLRWLFIPAEYETPDVVTADFNRDGYLDLATASPSTGSITIQLGSRCGFFSNPVDVRASAETPPPTSFVQGDFNNDGNPDLALAVFWERHVSVLLGDGRGGFEGETGYETLEYPLTLTTGDFNEDGDLDLAFVSGVPEAASLLMGNGLGGFSDQTVFYVDDRHAYQIRWGFSSLTTGDFNQDGHLDLAAANQDSHKVWTLLGDGTGRITHANSFVVGAQPRSVAACDFNLDGHPDLVTANRMSDNVSILMGDGTGGFVTIPSFPAGYFPYKLTAGDFDRDGNQDLAVANSYSDGNVHVLSGDGSGRLSDPMPYSAVGKGQGAITTTDFDGDGFLDLATVDWLFADSVSILRGDEGGGFSAPEVHEVAPDEHDLVYGHFNHDEHVDLAVTHGGDPGGVTILLGDGSGNFPGKETFLVDEDTLNSVAAADFNKDGNLDLAAANEDGDRVWILLGNGNGDISAAESLPVGEGPRRIETGDFNRDGNVDIVSANTGSHNVSVLLGTGSGDFLEARHFDAGTEPTFVAVGDFDEDRVPDLACSNAGNQITVLLGNGFGGFRTGETKAYRVGVHPTSIISRDFNGDGNLDLATSNEYSHDVSILLGDGKGRFFNPPSDKRHAEDQDRGRPSTRTPRW